MSSAALTSSILRVAPDDVAPDPFPHIIKDGIVDPELYNRMLQDFPPDAVFDANTTVGARAGRDLYRGDPAYDDLIASSEAWREFYDYVVSPSFVDQFMQLFGRYLRDLGCAVDPDKARFTNWVEPREILKDRSRWVRRARALTSRFVPMHNPDDLFVRLDIGQGPIGYGKPVHCDRPNRLCSLLVYFCDADDIEMEGGELRIHKHRSAKDPKAYERHPRESDTEVVATLRAQHNRGVFFVCSNNSYHSATPVTAQRHYRNFLYISIASRARSIW